MEPRLESCSWPALPEPYLPARKDAVSWILSRCDGILGIVASGTIVRGTPDPASDLDIYVVHGGAWRQRVQKVFRGVPAEIFFNPPARVERYFQDDRAAGRAITAHMIGTGHVVWSDGPVLDGLREKARAFLAEPPAPPSDDTVPRYMISSLYEDAMDVSRRDRTACRYILHQAVERMLEHAFRKAGRWLPRKKDLPRELLALDPALGRLARRFYRAPLLRTQLRLAGRIADRTLAARGFFEWEGGREPL